MNTPDAMTELVNRNETFNRWLKEYAEKMEAREDEWTDADTTREMTAGWRLP